MATTENDVEPHRNIVKLEYDSSDDDVELVQNNDHIADIPMNEDVIQNRVRNGLSNGLNGLSSRLSSINRVVQNGHQNGVIHGAMASGQSASTASDESGLTFKMTDNLLHFIRAVTNVQAFPEVVHAMRQERVTPPDSPNSITDDVNRNNSGQIRCHLSHGEKHEIAQFMTDNPKVSHDDVVLLFSAKFKKQISKNILQVIKCKGDKWLDESMRDSNKFKIRNSTFPEIEEKIVRLLDDADRTGSTLSSKYIRAKALEYAAELKIANFNASKGWLLKLLSRQNRKLGRTVDHLQKRKPFIRLSFGEKHIIAIYIKEHPNKTYPEYAKHFSELWERNVTARQIITTKENMEKWLNEAYKDCQQTHYKFVDEGSDHNGPMVMKRKRSRVMLTPEEREEISNFLADNRPGNADRIVLCNILAN